MLYEFFLNCTKTKEVSQYIQHHADSVGCPYFFNINRIGNGINFIQQFKFKNFIKLHIYSITYNITNIIIFQKDLSSSALISRIL